MDPFSTAMRRKQYISLISSKLSPKRECSPIKGFSPLLDLHLPTFLGDKLLIVERRSGHFCAVIQGLVLACAGRRCANYVDCWQSGGSS